MVRFLLRVRPPSNEMQFENVEVPRSVTVSGITRLPRILVQRRKEPVPIDTNPLFSFGAPVNPVQPSKAELPIVLMLAGNVMVPDRAV